MKRLRSGAFLKMGFQTNQDARGMPGAGCKHNVQIPWRPFRDAWKGYGGRGAELGKPCCRIDYPMPEGFGPGQTEFVFTNGGSRCRFI